MAFTHGLNADLYLGGTDISPYFKSASVDASKDTVETTAFGSVAKSYIPGLRDATASMEGMFEGTADAALAGVISSSALSAFSIYAAGDTAGEYGFGMNGIQTALAISASTDDVVQASAEIQSSTGAERIRSLCAKQAIAATGPLTAVDNAAATATGGVAYLHVFAPGTSVSVKVQDSVDNSTWTDLFTFTAATTAQAQRMAVAGTVKRYLRVNVTALTGGPATIQVGVGREIPTLP